MREPTKGLGCLWRWLLQSILKTTDFIAGTLSSLERLGVYSGLLLGLGDSLSVFRAHALPFYMVGGDIRTSYLMHLIASRGMTLESSLL